jgi:ferredoxin-NADP reductase
MAVAALEQALIKVRLGAVADVARDVRLYTFEASDRSLLPSYRPGAHVDLHLPNGMIRQYSLLDPHGQSPSYRLAVKRDPATRGGSAYIHDELEPGAELMMSAPRNHFELDQTFRDVVFIAGGIGITPIRCMIQEVLKGRRKWTLHYACRSREDAAFLDELAGLPEVRVHFDDQEGGTYLDIASCIQAASPDAHLYCCGPSGMISAFAAATAGWAPDQVHVEYFSAKSEPARSGGFIVELARSGTEHFIPEGQSILQVLTEAGIAVPSSCEQGICGTCETRVIAGVPEHRDSILSEAEQAANKSVMICCAGSKSERLVLDL